MPKTPDLTKWTYGSMFDRLIELGQRWEDPKFTIYNNTTVKWTVADDDDAEEIAVWLHETMIATVSMNGEVRAFTGGWKTVTTQRRIDYVLKANCQRRLVSVGRKWKVYTPADGTYEDFIEGHLYR